MKTISALVSVPMYLSIETDDRGYTTIRDKYGYALIGVVGPVAQGFETPEQLLEDIGAVIFGGELE